jgi:hypothetical protein
MKTFSGPSLGAGQGSLLKADSGTLAEPTQVKTSNTSKVRMHLRYIMKVLLSERVKTVTRNNISKLCYPATEYLSSSCRSVWQRPILELLLAMSDALRLTWRRKEVAACQQA